MLKATLWLVIHWL